MRDIKEKLKNLNAAPLKSMGQHFLADENVAERQVESAEIKPNETVLEIGPGLGILTEKIIERAARTVVIEKDNTFVEHLREIYRHEDNLRIIHEDVLDIDIPPFDKIISNIPFNISSPLTFRLMDEHFELGVLMYQKEYARRMVAAVGEKEYSRLSVMISTKAKVKLLFNVSRNCFFPPPAVDASVVMIIPSEPLFELNHPELFSEVVRELFNYRRKKIRNALECGFDIKLESDVPFGDKRVEKLTPKDISSMVDHLVREDIL